MSTAEDIINEVSQEIQARYPASARSAEDLAWQILTRQVDRLSDGEIAQLLAASPELQKRPLSSDPRSTTNLIRCVRWSLKEMVWEQLQSAIQALE